MDVCRELEKASIAAGCTLQSDAASDEAHFRMPAVLYRGTYGQGMVARFPDDKMYGFMHRVATADPKMSGFPVFGSEKARVLVYLVSQGAVPDEIQAKTKGIIESLQ
jgi:hypothetical protein